MSKQTPSKRPPPVPAAVSRTDLEIAFPWVCYLPPEAIREFLAKIDSYRAAAGIYSRKPACLADPYPPDQLASSAFPPEPRR